MTRLFGTVTPEPDTTLSLHRRRSARRAPQRAPNTDKNRPLHKEDSLLARCDDSGGVQNVRVALSGNDGNNARAHYRYRRLSAVRAGPPAGGTQSATAAGGGALALYRGVAWLQHEGDEDYGMRPRFLERPADSLRA
jgi:hypothetical protein